MSPKTYRHSPDEEAVEGEVVNTAPSLRKQRRSGFGSVFHGLHGLMLAGIVFILLPLLLLAAMILSIGFLGERILPLLLNIVVPILAVAVFILVPLALFERTKHIAVSLLQIAPIVYGITAWLLGFLITLQYWGVFAVILGVVIFGIGVIPLGFLAAAFHADWQAVLDIVVLVVLAYGFRRMTYQLQGRRSRFSIFYRR